MRSNCPVHLLVVLGMLAHVAMADNPPRDRYPDHSRLMVYADDAGTLQPVKTPADWARRRADILKGMEAAMGPLPTPAAWPAFDLQQTEELAGNGYVRKTYTFAVEADDRLPIDLYLPTNIQEGERRAAILALHPTGAPGKRLVGTEAFGTNRQYAIELAERGYVVVAPDYPSFGDTKSYDFAADAYVSGTMKGIFNHRRCVDLLQSLPQVDPERIGVIGHSLGGHNSMYVAAFDERIKAIVSSCGWDPFHHYYGGKLAGWTSDRYMPRIRDVYGLDPDKVPFDFYEVVAALAPRPFLSVSPVEDANFDVKGVEKAIARAREVYKLLGAEDALQLRTPKCEHDFPTESRLEAYAFLDRALGHTPAKSIDFSSELPRIPPLEPDAALASFEVLDGYKIEQTAAEPLVVDPVAMCFDARGRLYVVEMRDYSEQETESLGRVRLLTDVNGDGRFDQSVIFAEGLSWPTAITCSDGGVFVGAAPDIFYLKDTTGDDIADERRTVFTGFARGNVQGLMNSFHWGIDNRIHGSASTSGGTVTRPDDTEFQPVNLSGRDFSFDPRKLDLRPESGGGQHGMCFDDWGRKFVCSNSDHCQLVMYEDRYIARNPDFPAPGPRVSIAEDGGQAPVFRISPVEPWRIVRTRLRASGVVPGIVEGGGRPAGYFTSATGITIYRGDAMPELQGMVIVGDVGSNIVHRKKLTPDGVGFKATRIDQETEFVRSKDNWFRPVQFANGPDGCLHILDMYRETIEHPKSLPPEIKQHLDLTSGRDRGRLYRVTPERFTAVPVPNLNEVPTPDLVAFLDHANPWHRETASRLLHERIAAGDASAEVAVQNQYALSQTALGSIYSLYALAPQWKGRAGVINLALQHPEAHVRRHALRLAETVSNSERVRRSLVQLVADPDPGVRYQFAFTLGELPVELRTLPLVHLLSRDGGDPWMQTAALSSLHDGASDVLSLLLDNDDVLASPATKGPLVPLARLIGRQKNYGEIGWLLSAFQRPKPAMAGVSEVLLPELAAGNPRLFRTHVRGALDRLVANARTMADDEAAAPATRAGAVKLLRFENWEDVAELLTQAVEPQQPAEVQSAAIAVLGTYTVREPIFLLLDRWQRFSPAVRREAEEVVCTRPDGVLALLDRLEAGAIQPADLTAGRLQLLQASSDAEVKRRATALLAKLGTSSRQTLVEQYREAMNRRGDAERGRAVFRKTCAVCHKLENFGYELGPNLATMKNRGPEAIVLNVLDPNREVNPQFQSYLAVTTDGLTHTGMIQSETATAVTLSRGENKTETLLRSDIDELKSTSLSLMPEGLEKEIDVAALADLLAYLELVK